MANYNHRIIVITGTQKYVRIARKKALEIFNEDNGHNQIVSKITNGEIDTFATFTIIPDGWRAFGDIWNEIDKLRMELAIR